MADKRGIGGGGKSQGGAERVKKTRGRTPSQVRWLERQLNDPYVKAAKAAGYRSRAAFKLKELDERYKLLAGARRVIDLGVAPGGWAQVVLERNRDARVVGIDLLPVEPMAGLIAFERDFLGADVPALLTEALGGPADLVLSDMAANTTGHKRTDHLRTMGLCEAALEFAGQVLRPGGAFVAKVLAGGADAALVSLLKKDFAQVRHAKPPASRADSSEWYVIAQGFRGGGPPADGKSTADL